MADELAAAYPGRVEVMHRTGAARPRTLVRRRPAAGARTDADADLPDGRGPVAQSGVPAGAGRRGRQLRRGHRLALPATASASSTGRCTGSSSAPSPTATSRRSPGSRRADCTSGYRCWRREALAKIPLDRVVSDGYAFLVEMLFERRGRGCRIGEVPIIFVERRQGQSKVSSAVLIESLITPWRLRSAAGGDRERCRGEVVVMVTTSYPRFPGDSVGTFMEPIATSVAARGHEVHVVAPWHPARRASGGRARGPFPFLQVRAAPLAERLRLRRGDARRRQRCAAPRSRRAARARGRMACRADESRAASAPRSCTGTGWFPAASRRRWRRPVCRW